MTTTELLALFRTEVSDVETPYLWSDALVYGYIDEAQKQFCRDTYGIEDARTFTLSILADGTLWYRVDPRILKIRSAMNASTGAPIALATPENLANQGLVLDTAAGDVKRLITGLQKGMVRAHPVPNAAMTIALFVFRLPNEVAAGDDFEIDEQHVRNLLDWVKYRAYNVHDSEVYNPKLAAMYEGSFKNYCARALNEQSRLNHSAGTVAYGGI